MVCYHALTPEDFLDPFAFYDPTEADYSFLGSRVKYRKES